MTGEHTYTNIPGDADLGPGGCLFVCPTPIGNLKDITLRVLEVLNEVDVVACEDTRRTGLLLSHYGIKVKLLSYHEHNEAERTRDLVTRIEKGQRIALVSDAGMPGVSDPGYILVKACLDAQLSVDVLPGASSVTVALVSSGLPSESWCFVGFLPRKRSSLLEIFRNTSTVVAFESPRRAAKSLGLLAEEDPLRPVVICRELTKLHQETIRGTASELAQSVISKPLRGEVVLVIGGVKSQEVTISVEIIDAVKRLHESGAKTRVAVQVVAELKGVSANDLYNAALGESTD